LRFNFLFHVNKVIFHESKAPKDFSIAFSLFQPHENVPKSPQQGKVGDTDVRLSSPTRPSKSIQTKEFTNAQSPFGTCPLDLVASSLLNGEQPVETTHIIQVEGGTFVASEDPCFDVLIGKTYLHTFSFEQSVVTISIFGKGSNSILAEAVIDLNNFASEALYMDAIPLFSPKRQKKAGKSKRACVAVMCVQIDAIELNVYLFLFIVFFSVIIDIQIPPFFSHFRFQCNIYSKLAQFHV
jgi:hypothetical protein